MSAVAEVTTWLADFHPEALESSVSTKKTKKGKISKDTEQPIVQFLIDKVEDGTVKLLQNGRVVFPLTNHESVCKFEILDAYLKGKAYHKATKGKKTPVDLEKYAPYIVNHKSFPNKLYCTLSKTTLNNDEAEVARHVQGRRYLAALQRILDFQQKQKERREFKKLARAAKFMADGELGETLGQEGDEGDMLGMYDDEDMEMMMDEDEDMEMFDEDDFEEEEEEEEEVIVPPKKQKAGKVAAPVAPVKAKKEVSPVKPTKKAKADAAPVKNTKAVEVEVSASKKKKAPVAEVEEVSVKPTKKAKKNTEEKKGKAISVVSMEDVVRAQKEVGKGKKKQ